MLCSRGAGRKDVRLIGCSSIVCHGRWRVGGSCPRGNGYATRVFTLFRGFLRGGRVGSPQRSKRAAACLYTLCDDMAFGTTPLWTGNSHDKCLKKGDERKTSNAEQQLPRVGGGGTVAAADLFHGGADRGRVVVRVHRRDLGLGHQQLRPTGQGAEEVCVRLFTRACACVGDLTGIGVAAERKEKSLSLDLGFQKVRLRHFRRFAFVVISRDRREAAARTHTETYNEHLFASSAPGQARAPTCLRPQLGPASNGSHQARNVATAVSRQLGRRMSEAVQSSVCFRAAPL